VVVPWIWLRLVLAAFIAVTSGCGRLGGLTVEQQAATIVAASAAAAGPSTPVPASATPLPSPTATQIDAEYGLATRLTQSPGTDLEPAWSPDGRWLAFSSARDGNLNLYLLEIDSGSLIRLTEDPAGDMEPDWSRN